MSLLAAWFFQERIFFAEKLLVATRGCRYNSRRAPLSCLERLGSQLAYASGVLSRLDILMSSLLLAVSDVLSLTTIYIISSTVLVVLSSTG